MTASTTCIHASSRGIGARARFIACSLSLYVSLGVAGAAACHADERMVERTGTLRSIFPIEQAQRMSEILPLDAELRWRVREPAHSIQPGVLVFVNATDSGEPQAGWESVLDARELIWVGAVGYGNEKPSAQRVLAALLGLALVQQDRSVDESRVYIAGMSGGGRIASKTITKFPQLFTGAIYIVGVDYWTRAEDPLRDAIAANRYVFLTGEDDFNRRETRHVYRKYARAGVQGLLLMDLPNFGHEYPKAADLERAIRFLDGSD